MRFPSIRFVLLAALGASVVSCNDGPASPGTQSLSPRAAQADGTPAPVTKIVISQVYGGGGNSGATLKNDYVELFNAGNTTVDLATYSVQYASTSGSTWQRTNLTGSIAPGQYFLVVEAAGSGGTPVVGDLPANGGISMAAGAGKVALVSNQTTLSGVCPTAGVVDFVGVGTGTNCFEGTGPTGTLNNTNAAFRAGNGCTDTDSNAADFTVAVANPRTKATALAPCTVTPPVTAGPLDHVAIAGPTSLVRNATGALTATLLDGATPSVTINDPSATYDWQSADSGKVTFTTANGAASATIKGVAVTTTPIAITVTATSNGITKTQTQLVSVTAPPASINVSVGAGTPLVIGYETGVFASGTDALGNSVNSGNVTWSTSDPSILQVTDSRGIVRAVGEGTARVIATAADGSTGTFTLTTEVPLYNSSARVGHNVEFGMPADADPSNDVIIAREQYTISYNPLRGGPNWVSWDLSSTHLGTRNRCNCYSADTALVRLGYGQYMYNTADYTGGGYDRGHMEPSADQTKTDGENARTFFMTNFLPQKHGLNAGPWEDLENELRDSVNAGREAYVIAGGIFTNGVGLGTINNAGKIAIPDSTWKIVVLVPAGTGLANVASVSDVDVIAVNMPNVDAPGSNDWRNFRTTVAKIQKSTGYDFLAALPDAIECKVEGDDCAPTARIVGVTSGNEGSTLSFNGATSSDPDAGDVLSYQWSVNGQTVSIQPTISYTFGDNGSYVVRLIVADLAGKGDTTTTNVTIANVAPATTLTGATSLSITSGQSVTLTGAFTDPGSDSPWQYALDWKDGTTKSGTFASTGSASFTHQYLVAGTYTVPFSVTDKDGATTTSTVVISVGRVAVDGEANPSAIKLNDGSIANVSIRLTSSTIDVSTIDIASVRIAGVAPERGNLDQAGRRLSLDFTRQSLIDAGALTADTTELVLTATLTNGVQVVSHIRVSVH